MYIIYHTDYNSHTQIYCRYLFERVGSGQQGLDEVDIIPHGSLIVLLSRHHLNNVTVSFPFGLAVVLLKGFLGRSLSAFWISQLNVFLFFKCAMPELSAS